MILDLRPSPTFPFIAVDRAGRCRRTMAGCFPCGHWTGDGGARGLWAAFPSADRRGLDVVAGIRCPDGRVAGVRFASHDAGEALDGEARRRLADAPGRGGHFVDAVLAALAVRRAAADADRLLGGLRRDVGIHVMGGVSHMSPGFDVRVLAGRLSRVPEEVDVLAGALRGRPPRAGKDEVLIGARDMARTLAGAEQLTRLSKAHAEPFLDAVAGPALSFVEAEMAAGRSHVTLRFLDDAGWEALDDPADGRGLRAALDATPWHADAVLAARPAAGDPWPGDLHRLVASGLAVAPVPRRTCDAFARSGAGHALDEAHPTRFSSPEWVWECLPRTARGPDGVPAPTLPATAALSFLSRLPPEWRPKGTAEWDAFSRLAPLLMESRRRLGDTVPLRALLNVGGAWAAYERRLLAAAGPGSELAKALPGVHDLEWAFANQVIEPAACLAGPSRRRGAPAVDARLRSVALARECLWGGRSLVHVLDLSRRWHRGLHAMRVAVDALDPGLAAATSWDRGLPDAVVGDVAVTCLGTAAELREEGARGRNADGSLGMDHCVGFYGPKCLRAHSRILSLRRRGSSPVERLSTAEVTLGGPGHAVAQHQGRGNSRPPPECEAALGRYMAMVGDGSLEVAPIRARRVPAVPDAVSAAGYDFRVPGRFEAVRDLWDPHLPHPRRGWGAVRYAAAIKEGDGC